MADFLYERDGSIYAPTEWAGSPWSRSSQHGGPVNALFMHAALGAAGETGLRVARLTVDLLKPVPLIPLLLQSRFLRRGRRLAVFEADLVRPADGDVAASARAVLLLARDELGSTWDPPHAPPEGPEGCEPLDFLPADWRAHAPPGFHWSVQLRRAKTAAGPAVWASTPLELTPGEPLAPLERLAALCDTTFGASAHLLQSPDAVRRIPRGRLINTDTNLHLERAPGGEWFALADSFVADRAGTGLARVNLYDPAGRVGTSLQTLVANTG